MKLNNLKIRTKVWLPAIFFTISLIGIATFAGYDIQLSMMQDRKEKVQSLTESAYSVIQHFHDEETAGNLTREQAQKRALAAIEFMRYEDSGYFWIHNIDHVMVMHPISKGLEGKNMKGLKDKKGEAFFDKMTRIAQTEGEGFVSYYWPKKKDGEAIHKTSYIKLAKDWGWIVGTGLYTDDVDQAFADLFILFALIAGAVLFVSGGLSVLIAKNLSNGLTRFGEQISELAKGNLSVEITGRNRGDEIGDMAKALDVFKGKASEAEDLRQQQEQIREQSERERKSNILTLADALQSQVDEATRNMDDVVGQLSLSADTMQSNAQGTSQQSQSVAMISGQTSQNVQTVAAATEELNASSDEIGRQIEKTSQTAQAAANEAQETNEVIEGLSGAAGKIGEVVNMIQGIAEQTNLLALNATIEAARAGEAGKGFAVVASEVKNLANQTAKATDEVSTQITTIQTETNRAVQAIGGITVTINDMRDSSSAIAAAIEEQNAAIQEISRNIQEAAHGTGEISQHINTVSNDAQDTMASAQDVKSSSNALTQSSQELADTVTRFLDGMRERAKA